MVACDKKENKMKKIIHLSFGCRGIIRKMSDGDRKLALLQEFENTFRKDLSEFDLRECLLEQNAFAEDEWRSGKSDGLVVAALYPHPIRYNALQVENPTALGTRRPIPVIAFGLEGVTYSGNHAEPLISIAVRTELFHFVRLRNVNLHEIPSLIIQFFEEHDALDRLEPFVSEFGARFYGYPLNPRTIRFVRKSWRVPIELHVPDTNDTVVPWRAGEELEWQIAD